MDPDGVDPYSHNSADTDESTLRPFQLHLQRTIKVGKSEIVSDVKVIVTAINSSVAIAWTDIHFKGWRIV